MLAQLIDGARSTVDIAVYEFHLLQLADRLISAQRRGVQVRLLLEGGAVGGLVDQGRYVAERIHDGGGEVRFLIHNSRAQIWKRYTFMHAKYGVIDGRKTFVQSENFKTTGTPIDPTAGNRGWGVVLEDEGLGAYMTTVFNADWNPAARDSFPYTEETLFGPPAPGFIPDRRVPGGAYPHPFPSLRVAGPIDVTPVLAPDHSLLQTKGVIGLIRSARHTLLIEQQYSHLFWDRVDQGSVATTPNIFMDEAVQAARRGVKVESASGRCVPGPELRQGQHSHPGLAEQPGPAGEPGPASPDRQQPAAGLR